MQQLVAVYQLGNCHNMKIIANKVSFLIYVRVLKVSRLLSAKIMLKPPI